MHLGCLTHTKSNGGDDISAIMLQNSCSITEAVTKMFNMGHSMSNQHKKILTPTDLNENWFLHSVS